jgi:hypothetical protein
MDVKEGQIKIIFLKMKKGTVFLKKKVINKRE